MSGLSRRRARGIQTFAGAGVLAVALVLAVQGCSPNSRTESTPRRVIWIVVDSLRADHLGMHGYDRDTSPWLDALAERSVNFDWALSPSNETLVSVAAYFGGQPVSTMQPDGGPVQLPETVQTLAERLREEGFHTRALTANPKILPRIGYAQGFDDYRILTSPGVVKSSIDEMIEDLRASYRPTGGREFLYLHTMDVHHPYRPPVPFGGMFVGPYDGKHTREGSLVESDGVTLARSTHEYWSESHDIQPRDVEFLIGLYDGAIRYTDSRLPELLAALEWDPKRDVLIVTADHGEHFFEMGWWTHFATLTPMEIRVPLILNYDGFKARRVQQPVGLIDLYPTILDLFGLAANTPLDGKSLVPALREERDPAGEAYAETQPRHGLSAALVDNDHWYWMSGNRTTIAPWHAWPYEEYLFDYRADPGVETNRLREQPETARALNARLRERYPRWAEFTPERLAGDDDRVAFGPNLLEGVAPELHESEPATKSSDGLWRAEISSAAIRYRVDGLTPYEPLYLQVPYELETGALHLSFAPVEYLLPSRSRVRGSWQYNCLKPTSALRTLGVTVIPTSDTATLEIVLAPGTKANVNKPALRRMKFTWIEPWPRLLGAESAGEAPLSPAEEERLRTLGYVGD